MKPGARQDGGETAKLDQGRAEAQERLTQCSQFLLVYQVGEEGIAVVGACDVDFEFTAMTVLADHAIVRYLGMEEDGNE